MFSTLFVLRAISGCAQGLLQAFYSGILPGNAWRTLGDAKDGTWGQSCERLAPYSLYCPSRSHQNILSILCKLH